MVLKRNFENRPALEREWFSENTWCDICGQADLGMSSIREYEEDGKTIIEGVCNSCGGPVKSEVTTLDRSGDV
jgi:hypothetical protein